MLKKGISITSYNRPEILRNTLKRLTDSKLIDNYNVVIVQQNFNSKFNNIIKNFNFKNLHILKTSYPKSWGSYKKMTLNGLKGFSFCFEKLDCDISFYLEDDIMVSNDFFLFGEHILKKYREDKNFFAVNGFSKEPFLINKAHLYSKFVYGIGKGWGINKNRWKVIKKLWNKKFINSLNPEYDYPIENYIKKNNFYVVMPICSRTYEAKSEGVSIKKNDKEYFNSLKKSFVKIKNNNFIYQYSFFSKYNWRNDCKKYKGYILELVIIKMKKMTKRLIYFFR